MAYEKQQIYFDGKVQKASGNTFKTIDPSTGRVLAEVAAASNKDIDLSISSAKKAFPSWCAHLMKTP